MNLNFSDITKFRTNKLSYKMSSKSLIIRKFSILMYNGVSRFFFNLDSDFDEKLCLSLFVFLCSCSGLIMYLIFDRLSPLLLQAGEDCFVCFQFVLNGLVRISSY